MGYERYSRDSNQGGYYNPEANAGDYGRDYGSGRDYSYSSARQYAAAGEYDRNDDADRNRGGAGGERGGFQGTRGGYGAGDDYRSGGRGYGGSQGYGDGDRDDYGPREYGNSGYANRSQFGGERQDQDRYGSGYDQGRQDRSRGGYGGGAFGQQGGSWGGNDRSQGGDDRSSYNRQGQGSGDQDRGFVQRAGDEVRSWFGDDEASRRREQDARQDQHHHDADYHHWRQGQIEALDRDYAEYRQENRTKFANDFGTWRTGRQGQRDSLSKVKEHQDVVGSDGSHVGTVDHVRGDRILLTKNDQDAGGRHHSIPSSWIETVDDKVTLRKTADEAQKHWRDEENNQAMFGQQNAGSASGSTSTAATGSSSASSTTGASASQGDQAGGDHNLNRSFSGTY